MLKMKNNGVDGKMIQHVRPNTTLAEDLSSVLSTRVSSKLPITPSPMDPISLGFTLKHIYMYSIRFLLRNRTYRMNIYMVY